VTKPPLTGLHIIRLVGTRLGRMFSFFFFLNDIFVFKFFGRLGSLFLGRQKFCWDLHKAAAKSFNLSLYLFVVNLFFSLFF
jgi:hypothetical protein